MARIDDIIGPQFHALQRNKDGILTKWGDAILLSDGEYCYNGKGPVKSVRARMMNADIGVGDVTHVMIHDLAHCDDLLIAVMLTKYTSMSRIRFTLLTRLFIRIVLGAHPSTVT